MDKILVTGSAGFIGSNLINQLKDNNELYALIRNSDNRHQNVKYIVHDFLEQFDPNKLPSDIDCIIHLAATMDKNMENIRAFEINTFGTLNLLEYGKRIGIKKFIFASTGGVYGYSSKSLSEDSKANPIGFYGLSKYQSEILAEYYSQYFSVAILRLFFPYGEKQIRGIIPSLYNRIINGQAVIIYNDEQPNINPIYISDVIEIIKRMINFSSEQYTLLNIAGTEIVSIKGISDKIGDFIGISPKYEYVIDDKISNLIGDITKMNELYHPQISLNDGIEKTIFSYKY